MHLLMVEDCDDDAVLIVSQLRGGGLDVSYDRVETAGELTAALRAHPPDLVTCDYNMPALSAEHALKLLADSELDVPFILVSGQVGEETAAALMRCGAHDFLLKDRLTRLVPAVQRELREAADRRKRRHAEQERERLEQQLHQTERLESLGRLAGGVAHDFNNLLSVIMGYAEMLAETLSTDDPRRADIGGISLAAERAAALTRQLLTFSRQKRTQAETLNLNDVVTATESLLRRTIGEDVEFVTQLDPGLSQVTIDPTGIEQVVMNLCVNSRAAMPHGGRITITTANVGGPAGPARGPRAPEGRWACLTVADTGCGMPPEVARRALEPFFTTKGPGEGTGLGLATVYGVVTAAEGRISIDSQVGQGTTIGVLLPCSEQSASRRPAAGPAGPDRRGDGETILVVEDNEAVRDITTRILARSGYQVHEAGSPAEALERFGDTGTRIDALLTDVVMPGMSGYQLVERFRRRHPALPAMLVSGYAAGGAPGAATAPADLPHLQKPFTAGALLSKVHELLGPS
ncbi:response regulator [Frankia tisae]|uniref:response regulator n=2 Tax=Frankia tisae TaxID=2950104 RepID=UPI0021BF49C9|nr:response regulator [Frankia tisae]